MQKQSHRAIDKAAENKYWQNQFRNESYYEAWANASATRPAWAGSTRRTPRAQPGTGSRTHCPATPTATGTERVAPS